MATKLIMLALFFAVTIGVGIFYRKSSTVEGFVLGNRGVGGWLTAFAYGTSYFSAVILVGYAGQFGWDNGISAIWIGIGNALIGSLFAWVVLARRTRVMTNSFSAATMPEFFEKRYDSKGLKLTSALIIFVFLIPYSASVYKGLSALFSRALGVDFTVCIVVMAVVTGLYVVLGGYMATAVNDLIQGFIMLVGIVLVVFSVLSGKGGFTAAVVELSQVPLESNPGFLGAFTSLFGPDPKVLFSVVILTSLGTWGLPQMVHKFYAIKNERAIRSGTVISTVFAVVVGCGCYFLGGFSRIFYDGSNGVNYGEIMPTMLTENLPDVLVGVVLMLVLSASMSTLASLVLTSSSTFVLDFVKGKLRPNIKEKGQMLLIRILCAVFIVLSVVLALWPGTLISALMSVSWGALAGAFLGPYMYGLFSKRITRAGVWASFAVGIGITIFNLFVPLTGGPESSIVAGALAIVSSLVVCPIVSLFTKKMDGGYVDSVFSCFEKKVSASSRQVLVDSDSDGDSFKPYSY